MVNGNNLPGDSTPLNDSMAMVHQIFLNMLAVGFSEWQACVIIGVMISNSGNNARGTD